MQLSGWVKILDENGTYVEVRDLGPKPIDCKPGRVEQIDPRPSPSHTFNGAEWVEYVPPINPDDIRAQRDELLRASDWTQLADAPVNSFSWAVYRQELRDLPLQPGFPASVIWPVPPN